MDSRMLEATHNGATIELQTLLNGNDYLLEGSSLNESPETILHVAVLSNQIESVKVLMNKKPDLATRLNRDGFSPIHIASANGFVEIVREILKVNHELARLKSSDGRTALHCAAITGRILVIKELLEFCLTCIKDVTSRGETALHLAVKNNKFEAFKTLVHRLEQLNNEELLNMMDEDGNTLLHLATAKMQTPTHLKFLLDRQYIEQGALMVNAMNKSGLTP